MKFLKKDVTEGNQVAGIVDRMAISHPEISFRFIRDGKQVLITSGNGDLKSTVYSVLGKEMSDSLMSVDYSFNDMRITGFVSKPTASRKSRAGQYFYINNRIVKSKTAMAALEQAYKNTIMVGRFPACVLNIELNPAQVDVNVHPAKTEVRFANEKPIFDLVYYAVKTAIENAEPLKRLSLKKIRFIGKSLKTFIKIMIINRFRRNLISLKRRTSRPHSRLLRLSRERIFGRLKRRSPNIKLQEMKSLRQG